MSRLSSFLAVAACAALPTLQAVQPPSQPEQPAAAVAAPAFAGPGMSTTYSSVRVNGPFIALTFDDGPHKELTPKLLDLLKEKNVKATFFVIGRNADAYPDIMKRIVAEGHEIANHSWSHPDLAKLPQDTVKGEVGKTDDAITRTTGKKAALLRPPYGAFKPDQREWARSTWNYRIILWDVDPLDWRRPGAEVVTQRLVSGAKPGSILLAHDIHAQTVDAMPSAIDQLLARGLQFVTVSELLKMEQPPPAKVGKPGPTGTAAAPTTAGPAPTPTPMPFDAILRAEPVLSPEQASKLPQPTPTPTPKKR